MKNLLILGCGGHGSVVADAAEKTNEYGKISFLDDKIDEIIGSKANFKNNIIGVISEKNLRKFAEEFSDIFVGIGNNEIRIKWLKKIERFGMKIPNIIHPSAQVSKYVDIGYGSFINTNVVIQCNSKISSGCIINTSSSIDHDSWIDEGTHISPGVNIAGNVKIGKRSWIGIGSKIIQNISIGDDVIVGAGSLVLENIPSNFEVYGSPAKKIKIKINK